MDTEDCEMRNYAASDKSRTILPTLKRDLRFLTVTVKHPFLPRATKSHSAEWPL